MELAIKRPSRLFPKATDSEQAAANYAAVEIHGFYGLIDDGSEGAGRMLILHVPRWVKGYFMDIRQGDTLHVYSATEKWGAH